MEAFKITWSLTWVILKFIITVLSSHQPKKEAVKAHMEAGKGCYLSHNVRGKQCSSFPHCNRFMSHGRLLVSKTSMTGFFIISFFWLQESEIMAESACLLSTEQLWLTHLNPCAVRYDYWVSPCHTFILALFYWNMESKLSGVGTCFISSIKCHDGTI